MVEEIKEKSKNCNCGVSHQCKRETCTCKFVSTEELDYSDELDKTLIEVVPYSESQQLNG
jgi:hypothetical protein